VAPPPLTGIRVLDLSRLLPGPMATLHLADLGATVIRITDPVRTRDFSTVLDPILHRGKQAIRLDLWQPAGRDEFLELAREADVLVESFRPGVVDQMGIGYETVREKNPRVVYCSISGYGQTGPDCMRSGHDINYLAASGVADQIGLNGHPPAIPNLQVGDLLGGALTAVMGILAALVGVKTHGTGRYIDVSMTDSLMAHSVVALVTRTLYDNPPGRGEGALSGGLACYNYYRTEDGRYLAVGALERKFWERLCDTLARPDLKPGHFVFGEESQRVRGELEAIFAAKPAAHWLQVFRDVDCCVNLVLTLEEAINSEQTRARETVVEADKHTCFAPPLKFRV
jgi:alpha-methylacyl-CoA racemase